MERTKRPTYGHGKRRVYTGIVRTVQSPWNGCQDGGADIRCARLTTRLTIRLPVCGMSTRTRHRLAITTTRERGWSNHPRSNRSWLEKEIVIASQCRPQLNQMLTNLQVEKNT